MNGEIKSGAEVLPPKPMTAKEKAEALANLTEADKRKRRCCFAGHRPQKLTRPVDDIKVDLENEISSDIDSLVDLKAEMVSVIKNVRNPELQTLLELRYLCFKTWEQIAVELGYSIESIYRLHREALKNIKMPRKLNSK